MKRAAVGLLFVLVVSPTIAGGSHDHQSGGPVIYIHVIYNKGPGAPQDRLPQYAANSDIAECLRKTVVERRLPVQFTTDEGSATYLLAVESNDLRDCARLEQQGFALVCAGWNESTRIVKAELVDTKSQQVVWSDDGRKWNGMSHGWLSPVGWECRTGDFAKQFAKFIKKR